MIKPPSIVHALRPPSLLLLVYDLETAPFRLRRLGSGLDDFRNRDRLRNDFSNSAPRLATSSIRLSFRDEFRSKTASIKSRTVGIDSLLDDFERHWVRIKGE